jgi:hypothetical protein
MIQQRGVFDGRCVLSTRALVTVLADQVGDATIVKTPAVETWRYGIGNGLEDPALLSRIGLLCARSDGA